MWMINGQVRRIKTRFFKDGNGVRQLGYILSEWSKEQLAEIGVKRFREVAYDKDTVKSTGYTDEEVDGVMVRTHTTEPLPAEVIERKERQKRLSQASILDILLAQLKQDKADGKELLLETDALLTDLADEKTYRDSIELAMEEEVVKEL